MPRSVGTLVSTGKATIAELSTIYGLEDAYDMLEVDAVDAHNRRLLSRKPSGGN